MDNLADTLYLKQFVKENPDNQMGWYLLGKHYLQAGKEGKANYCFIQAGEVYDAFEQESHPIAEYQLQQLKLWDKKQKRKKKIKKAVLLAVPLLLTGLYMTYYYNSAKPEAPVAETVEAESSMPYEIGVLFLPISDLKPAGSAVHKILTAGQEAPKLTIAAQLEQQGNWYNWGGSKKFLLSVMQVEGPQLDIKMYDRELCRCEPASSSELTSHYDQWSKQQEYHWTLASGIMQYERLYKKWPQSLGDLIMPYPNNILSGESSVLKDKFNYVLSRIKQTKHNNTNSSAALTDISKSNEGEQIVGTNGLFQEGWDKPLEIIIDISNHQLAVVHNNMIIRSFPVGLGGERTPKGSFYISEKIKSPNGSDNGIFGSRGMALSNTLYAVHGTNKADSIGEDESQGCIRMSNKDVEELYDMVPLGTAVHMKYDALPRLAKAPAGERFKLEPLQDETNPNKIYRWLQ